MMSPIVFQELLRFLYTGQIHSTRINKELLKAAKCYEIETLYLVGMASGKHLKVDHDKLSDFMMSFDG